MPLTPGTTLGSYSIIAKIGAGGMGQVYRATDTKLDRDVALKVLPEAFTSDPDRLARFEREAKVLASLNHRVPRSRGCLVKGEGRSTCMSTLFVRGEGPTRADPHPYGSLRLLCGGRLAMGREPGLLREEQGRSGPTETSSLGLGWWQAGATHPSDGCG